MSTRGTAISAYSPAFSKGAQVYGANIASGVVTSAHIADGTVVAGDIGAGSITSAKIRAAFLSGTLVSGRTTRAIAHGLGVRPKFVIVVAMPTLTQANISATATVNQVFLAAASAATSANFYVIGTQAANAAIKYCAYVQL